MERMGVELVHSNNAAFKGKTVFIVRHAQGQHNVSPRFEFDPPLTPAGLKQVAAAACAIKVVGRAEVMQTLAADLGQKQTTGMRYVCGTCRCRSKRKYRAC